ncbi:MAG: hypothetical protein IJJ26_06535 [Victivallales bacterium]|nr:hypothetical protein [Victivallales bacterium]
MTESDVQANAVAPAASPKQNEDKPCALCKLLGGCGKGEERSNVPVPAWLTWLCAGALLLMLNQIKLPVAGGKLALADLAFLAGFVPVFLFCLMKKRGLFYPVFGVVVLFAMGVANLCAASGLSGAVEVAQLIQMLFCGTMMISFLVENAPRQAVWTVLAAIGLNVLVAWVQWGSVGFGAQLAPADVLAVKCGFGGGSYSGLFRSRMALGFFLACALAWVLPSVYGKKATMLRYVLGMLLTIVVLLSIAHGEMLFLATIAALGAGFLHSRRAGIATSLGVFIVILALAGVFRGSHTDGLLQTMSPLKQGEYAGELRTNHLDFFAAMRMAMRQPWHGIGSGRYQSCIGRCYSGPGYDELPNPSWNDIETDTQAGWGILTSTQGLPVAALFFVLLLSVAALGFRQYARSNGEETTALGGALLLLVVLAGMFVTDPLMRGTGWLLALGFGSAVLPGLREKLQCGWRLSPGLVLFAGVLMALPLAAGAVRKKVADPLAGAPVPVQTRTPGETETTSGEDVFLVVDASQAKNITKPVEKGTDSQAAKNAVLKIPDGKGVPPDDKEPAMQYGGAEFEVELKTAATVKIWLRVWWDGSCGNTLNIQVDDEERSATVGNDGTYRVWHWMEAPRVYKLEAGKHKICLLNREDGIMFDQMLITGDPQYVPQGIEEE